MKKILVILIVLFITGCATIPAGYTPNKNLNDYNVKLDKKDRKDITFSISYYSQVSDDETEKFYKMMMKSVKENFAKTKLFRRVHYVPFEQKGKYHYHFDMKLTGTPPNKQLATGLLSGYTLMLFPMSMEFYVDTTMFLYVNNKEVYSVSSPELVRDVYWLPFIILSPFLNHSTVGSSVINNNIEYFIGNIIENKLY